MKVYAQDSNYNFFYKRNPKILKAVKIEIKDTLDLKTMCSEYKMTPAELREFHNEHCEIYDFIPKGIPKYLQSLYIPEDRFLAWKDRQNIFSAPLSPQMKDHFTYGVVINQHAYGTKIHYLIHLRQKKDTIFSITRDQVFINDEEPEMMVEKMVNTAAEALYPLEIDFLEDRSMQAIANIDEVQKRWQSTVLPSLLQYYEGDVAQEIINQFDRFYLNMTADSSFLKKDLFLNIYFFILSYVKNRPQKPFQFPVYFAAISQSLTYELLSEIDKKNTTASITTLIIKGQEKTDSSLSAEKGELFFTIKYNIKSRTICSIVGELILYHDSKKNGISIEIYEMNEYI